VERRRTLKAVVTIDKIKRTHAERRTEIRAKLEEFAEIWRTASDERLWEEMVFCFFTGGCSAKMGLRSIEAVRPLLMNGTQAEIEQALLGKHRYPRARARYIVETRDFLLKNYGMQIRQLLSSFNDPLKRRDWLAKEKGIKGLGYKEASHFLRNIGFRGYAILDKHILRCLAELKIINDESPPKSRAKYLEIEQKLKDFSKYLKIDFDEMDFVLWSIKTGEILK
jgi:N-glycosylase/DNA lyase